jgi:hypothetical protein
MEDVLFLGRNDQSLFAQRDRLTRLDLPESLHLHLQFTVEMNLLIGTINPIICVSTPHPPLVSCHCCSSWRSNKECRSPSWHPADRPLSPARVQSSPKGRSRGQPLED